MTRTQAPELAIIIVNFNNREDLLGCLESLTAQPPAVTHEIVLVDNASTDGSVDAVRSRFPGVRVVVLERNLGFAGANNVGIRATSSELVLLLNSDTLVPPGALDVLVGRLRAHPDAAVAGPRLIDGDGRAELSFGPMIAPLAELRQKLVNAGHQRGVGPVTRYVERITRVERFVDWVSGAALLVCRRDAEAVGLIDERYFIYTEDVDFCAAIRARGRRILFAPAATITHLRGRVRAKAPVMLNLAYRRSHVAFYEKHHPRWAPLLRLYLRLKGQLPDRS